MRLRTINFRQDRNGWLFTAAMLVMALPAFMPVPKTGPRQSAGFMLQSVTTSEFETSRSVVGFFSGAKALVPEMVLEVPDYLPKPDRAADKVKWNTCEVTWYDGYKSTASGQKYDPQSATCAVMYRKGSKRPRLPFGTKIEFRLGDVTSVVKVNNTGSHKPKKSDWWFDLTPAQFKKFAPLKRGVLKLEWRVL